MALTKNNKLWKNRILPLIGTGGIGAIIIALINHGGGHNVTTGNISGNVAIGDHATIQIGTNPPTRNQSTENLSFRGLTPLQIIKEIRAARPAAHESVAKSFEGASVDWNLQLTEILNDYNNTNLLLVITRAGINNLTDTTVVKVLVDKSQLPQLNLLPNDATVRVRGTIFEANSLNIGIWKASITPQ